MKTYGQYCAMARGLDVVGDRWSLLVVRDLLDGPRRYGELREGLPGIATNLLGQRLRDLVEAGVVVHGDDGRYALSAWGEQLRDVLYALGRWATPLMARPPGDDGFRVGWLRHLVAIHLGEVDDRRADGVVEVRVGGDVMTVIATGGRVLTAAGTVGPEPDVVVEGPPDGVGALVIGVVSLPEARRRGVTVTGDAAVLAGLRPAVGSVPRRAGPTAPG
ncbi:helix-turn-helix transcriptional regulator [Iamia sp. SCSIO 61187]|uniref:winged helix-turn-helix transcriptional regulator n=1 Tax=Iamia sp. SCSIO 61187 TaxID=2722752 RepID=UPI001C6298BD|nr:helix-turn-helix domain-containing protein [Iamia sp. SCSIO 61187]QYG95173.1 helix-turn-helix transcriptional regulator [Iamia sp. SCSIO 61187]